MKKNEIKPGVIYAYQRSREYGSPEPVVFLDIPSEGVLHRTASDYKKADEPAFLKAAAGSKPQASRGSYSRSSVGYAAVFLSNSFSQADADPADLLKPTVADFEKCTSGYAPAGFDGLKFALVTSLTYITGEYDEKLAEDKAQREADRDARRRDQAERDAADARAASIGSALARLDVEASLDRSASGYLKITLDDAEKLLALLEAANVTG